MGALDAIGGNALLAPATDLVSLALAAAVPAPPPNGFGALVDRGGKAALAVGLAAGAGAAEDAENGFLGAAVLIGGNALLEVGFAAAAAGAGAFVLAENGFLGAAVLIGGNALLEEAGLAAGAGAAAFDAENGFLGAAVLIGGNALLLAATGLAAGDGAAEAFVVAEKGVGALVARGGKLALEDGAVFISFFSTLSGTLEPN